MILTLLIDRLLRDRPSGRLQVAAAIGLACAIAAAPAMAAPAAFGNPGLYDTGPNPENVNAGDLDGDGDLDLVISSGVGFPSVSVLKGNGDGTFQAQVVVGTGSTGPRSSTLADFNLDGRLDVAVACLEGGSISVLLGNGDGTFQSPMLFAAAEPFGVTSGDVDLDGKPDLAVASLTSSVSILRGNGDGTFQPAVEYAAEFFTYFVAFGRFNGDAYPDMAAVNLFANTVSIFTNNGDGTFASEVSYATDALPKHVSVGDLDGDGFDDVVTANEVGGSVSVLRCNGDGTFQPAVSTPVAPGLFSAALADVNRDGVLDIVTANRYVDSSTVLFGNGDATFQTSTTMYVGGSAPQSVIARDFNADGRPDLAFALTFSDKAAVWLNATPASPGVNRFRDVRRPNDIDSGPDLCGTGQVATNFTGSTGSAGDTWLTLMDYTPANGVVKDTFGSVTLTGDVSIHRFNNKKGGGLVALYNEAVGKSGLALIVYDNGNTDTLVLATDNQAGQLVTLNTVSLGSGILENAWYRVTMNVDVSGGGVAVTGTVYKHANPADPDSALGTQVGGTLTRPSGPRPAGVDATGEVGIVASAISAVVDSSVTNFEVGY